MNNLHRQQSQSITGSNIRRSGIKFLSKKFCTSVFVKLSSNTKSKSPRGTREKYLHLSAHVFQGHSNKHTDLARPHLIRVRGSCKMKFNVTIYNHLLPL